MEGVFAMWLDSRIPVLILLPGQPVPPPEPDAVLLLAPASGTSASDGATGGMPAEGWRSTVVLPDEPPDAHGGACACCGGRSALARTLTALFQEWVRDRRGPPGGVLAPMDPDRAERLRAVLAGDPFVMARFRAVTG
jgi:hypothetical protein